MPFKNDSAKASSRNVVYFPVGHRRRGLATNLGHLDKSVKASGLLGIHEIRAPEAPKFGSIKMWSSTANDDIQGLILACGEGSNTAFSSLIACTYSQMRALVTGMGHNNVRERAILRKIYTKVWDRSSTYKSDTLHPDVWFLLVAREVCKDESEL